MLCDLKLDANDLYFGRYTFDLEAVVKNAIRRVLTPGRAWRYYLRTLDGVRLAGSEFQNTLPESLSHPVTNELITKVRENISQVLRSDKRMKINPVDIKVIPVENAGKIGLFVEVRYTRGTGFETFTMNY